MKVFNWISVLYYSLIKQFMRIASANWILGKKLMKVIHAQEQALVFEKFMNEDAYQIGTKIKQGVEKLGHDVVDSISLGDEQLFYYAIQSIAPSTSADLAERSAQPTCSGRVRIWSAWRWQPAAIRLPIPVWNLQSSQV